MLKSEKFFGKRDNAAAEKPLAHSAEKTTAVGSPAVSSLHSSSSTSTPARVVPASISNSVSSSFGNSSMADSSEMRSKLTVGPNIKLRGVEITDCDTLVVEGRVEASIDSRVIQISEKGAFVGNAEFEFAEIRGEFDGELTVRQKLVVYSSGRVTGKIRYGKLVIEEGGQLSGDIQISAASKPLAVVMAG